MISASFWDSEVRLGSTCYALYEDELWYKALVVDLHDDTDQFSVTYDNYDEVCRVDKAHVLPLGRVLFCYVWFLIIFACI